MRASLVLAVLAALVVATPSPARQATAAAAACHPTTGEETSVIIDGDLYGMIRSPDDRYLFGASGPPVLSLPEALRLIRALGLGGSDLQLLARLSSRALPGGQYLEGGSIGYFQLRCPGVYRATVVVRRERFLPATRLWLHTATGQRAFCMTPQWLPGGARLSVTFAVPLQAAPPAFTIDRDADGKADGRGSFRPGGARFPLRDRC